MKLSVVILTRNEKGNIKGCLDSVKFADEIIVVDDFSSDETREIAEKYGALIFKRKLGSNFSTQRNFGLKKTNGDWIFFIDADERVSIPLKKEIIQIINSSTNRYSGYYLKRLDSIWGHKLRYGEMGKVKLLRLGKKDAGKWKRTVHEAWNIKGEIGELKNPLLHYPHPSVNEYLSSINKYSSLHSIANKGEGKDSSLVKIIVWPVGKFVYNYFIRLGFLDGLAGFVAVVLMSYSSFLSWSKLQMLQQKSNKNS